MKKISFKNVSEILSENEMKSLTGGAAGSSTFCRGLDILYMCSIDIGYGFEAMGLVCAGSKLRAESQVYKEVSPRGMEDAKVICSVDGR